MRVQEHEHAAAAVLHVPPLQLTFAVQSRVESLEHVP
jgi:hypothetical protein